MKFFIIVITIVISMVFNQTLITTEARRLSKKDGQDHYKAGSADEFVSTSPGNTPGNANVEGFQDDFKPTEERRLQKTNGQDQHFKTGSTDDFAPTTRGNSPGIGHKKGNAKVEGIKDDFKLTGERKFQNMNSKTYFKTGSKDDFAPTTPGNSPGIGHKKGNGNVKEFKDDFKPTVERRMKKTNGQDHQFKTTGSTDDFTPTFPGNSPGIGHKKGNAKVEGVRNDFKPTELQKNNVQDHQFKTTGNTDDFAPTSPGNSPGMGHKKGDDFKPTTPGHSPGIGHAVKNNEPKV